MHLSAQLGAISKQDNRAPAQQTPAFYNTPLAYNVHPFMEHPYAEIPPASTHLNPEPLHISHLKTTDYKMGKSVSSFKYNNDTNPSMGQFHTRSTMSETINQQHYIGLQSSTRRNNQRNNSVTTHSSILDSGTSRGMVKLDDAVDMDIYSDVERRSTCPMCSRQLTLHILVMALMGLAYLAVGGLTGYYIGKHCKYKA